MTRMEGGDIDSLQCEAVSTHEASGISKDSRSGGKMIFMGLEIGGTNLGAGVLDGETGELLGRPHKEPLPKDLSAREPQVLRSFPEAWEPVV